MTWLTEVFEPSFMQRALIASLLAVAITSLVGTWVVLRGLAFLGDAISHGVVPGLALAVLWGFSLIIGALAAALIMAIAVALVSSRTTVREDTGIGLLFVGMLSLGVVIVSRTRAFATEVTSLLFGDVLGVTWDDVRMQVIALVIVVVVSVVMFRPFMALTFNRDKALTLGMRPGVSHIVLMALLAVSIVASFETVGTLLVFGLLIGPPATAGLLVRRVPTMIVLSMLFGALAVVAGLVVSFHYSTAGGATMALFSVLIFFIVLAAREIATALSSTPAVAR
ncbi:MAG: zinc ABC transporter permease AztB [Actinomycetota bacterium]